MIYIINTDAQTLKREENEQQKTNQKTLVSLCRERQGKVASSNLVTSNILSLCSIVVLRSLRKKVVE